jgi:hypothetical protein
VSQPVSLGLREDKAMREAIMAILDSEVRRGQSSRPASWKRDRPAVRVGLTGCGASQALMPSAFSLTAMPRRCQILPPTAFSKRKARTGLLQRRC